MVASRWPWRPSRAAFIASRFRQASGIPADEARNWPAEPELTGFRYVATQAAGAQSLKIPAVCEGYLPYNAHYPVGRASGNSAIFSHVAADAADRIGRHGDTGTGPSFCKSPRRMAAAAPLHPIDRSAFLSSVALAH
jgi:hypothetical protein